jgi:hypothetical protein
VNIFANGTANAGFGALVFGVVATTVVVAGFKYRLLKNRKTLLWVAFAMLLVTINSRGIFGELAGAARHIMNAAGEGAVRGGTGARTTPNPPRSTVNPVSAGGAALGLAILAWYVMKAYAAPNKWKPDDWREMAFGTVIAVCYGTSLGFMGIIASMSVLTGNNIGLWIFGG